MGEIYGGKIDVATGRVIRQIIREEFLATLDHETTAMKANRNRGFAMFYRRQARAYKVHIEELENAIGAFEMAGHEMDDVRTWHWDDDCRRLHFVVCSEAEPSTLAGKEADDA